MIVWLVLTLLGAIALVRLDIAERRARFQAEARTVHRLLSQQAAQHDAILASLVALDPGPRDAARGASGSMPDASPLEASLPRLPALYPQLLAIQRRVGAQPWQPGWPGHAGTTGRADEVLVTALADAEARSQAMPASRRSAVMTAFDTVQGRYALVLAGSPASYALWIDARQLVIAAEWPAGPVPGAGARQTPVVDLQLATSGGRIILHDGTDPVEAAARPVGLTEGFRFDEPIDSPAQPFLLSLRRATGPAEWPWRLLASWALAVALLVAAIHAHRRAREAQRREVEIGRLGRMTQLNNLGELAAGIAHELNQPLAAVLSSTQAAQRLLPAEAEAGFADDGDLDAARRAMGLAAGQARRAADVLARLRRLVEPPGAGADRERVDPLERARDLVDLLAPEWRRDGIEVRLGGDRVAVRADPVALEQVLYNLVRNAMQALKGQGSPRRITVKITADGPWVRLSVRDNGPGLSAETLAHLFEPFYTTRDRGLGLGLALCESLARAQDGTLEAIAHRDGAEFVLSLPAFSADETVAPSTPTRGVPPGAPS